MPFAIIDVRPCTCESGLLACANLITRKFQSRSSSKKGNASRMMNTGQHAKFPETRASREDNASTCTAAGLPLKDRMHTHRQCLTRDGSRRELVRWSEWGTKVGLPAPPIVFPARVPFSISSSASSSTPAVALSHQSNKSPTHTSGLCDTAVSWVAHLDQSLAQGMKVPFTAGLQ